MLPRADATFVTSDTQHDINLLRDTGKPECVMKRVRVALRQCDREDTVAIDHGQAQRVDHPVAKMGIITIVSQWDTFRD